MQANIGYNGYMAILKGCADGFIVDDCKPTKTNVSQVKLDESKLAGGGLVTQRTSIAHRNAASASHHHGEPVPTTSAQTREYLTDDTESDWSECTC
jgi:hypothetical protein